MSRWAETMVILVPVRIVWSDVCITSEAIFVYIAIVVMFVSQMHNMF